jgi:hypothetical protein
MHEGQPLERPSAVMRTLNSDSLPLGSQQCVPHVRFAPGLGDFFREWWEGVGDIYIANLL